MSRGAQIRPQSGRQTKIKFLNLGFIFYRRSFPTQLPPLVMSKRPKRSTATASRLNGDLGNFEEEPSSSSDSDAPLSSLQRRNAAANKPQAKTAKKRKVQTTASARVHNTRTHTHTRARAHTHTHTHWATGNNEQTSQAFQTRQSCAVSTRQVPPEARFVVELIFFLGNPWQPRDVRDENVCRFATSVAIWYCVCVCVCVCVYVHVCIVRTRVWVRVSVRACVCAWCVRVTHHRPHVLPPQDKPSRLSEKDGANPNSRTRCCGRGGLTLARSKARPSLRPRPKRAREASHNLACLASQPRMWRSRHGLAQSPRRRWPSGSPRRVQLSLPR
mgnify:CR=1 FL=1